MVVIPAGTFLMGASASEKSWATELEQAVHRVKVRGFAAGRFDVTRDEYAAFVRATKRPTTKGCVFTGRPGATADPQGSWSSLGFKQTGRDPVVCVSWFDAQAYVGWLTKRTGKHYRLLSEAEWEYAARAGSTTPFYWGQTADRAHVNYGQEKGWGKGVAKGKDRWVYTSPAGSFPPNRFGLYDMSGNVLQFVEDCLSLSYNGVPGDGSAYTANGALQAAGDLVDLDGKMSCTFRMVRGGDWGDPPEGVRTAARNFAPDPSLALETYRSGGVGFRVARDLHR
ncbi:MAG: formylglycine-generating enzyme family protein [Sphingomonas sp.]|nr:formylglycine-generating enzyme family protein [Sphingomonas sp.]